MFRSIRVKDVSINLIFRRQFSGLNIKGGNTGSIKLNSPFKKLFNIFITVFKLIIFFRKILIIQVRKVQRYSINKIFKLGI